MSHREVVCLARVQCHRLSIIDEEFYADSSFKCITVYVGILCDGFAVCGGTYAQRVNTSRDEELTYEVDAFL